MIFYTPPRENIKEFVMKKIFLIILALMLVLSLAACGGGLLTQDTESDAKQDDIESEVKQESPFDKAVSEGWDIYASLDCFVKTEYNSNNNPVKRELYSVETWEKGFEIRYDYDMSGNLEDVRLDAKAASSQTHKDARFALSFDKKSMKTKALPLFDNDYELSFLWDDHGRMISESWKSSAIEVIFSYDEKGNVKREIPAEQSAIFKHRYSDDKSNILITEEDSLSEKLTLTFGENGKPSEVKTPEYAMEYTYNEKNRCTLITTEVVGVKLGETVLSYDAKGNLVKCETKAIANGVETPAARYEFSYDENGNLIHETVLMVNALLQLKINYDRAYEYDAEGRLIKETEGIYPRAGQLSDNRITDYEYDEKGNKVQLTQTVAIPSGKVTKDKAIACYTEKGTLLSYTDFEFHTNGTVSKTLKSEYDEDEKLVKATELSYYVGEKVDGVLVDGPLYQKTEVEQKPDGKKIKAIVEEYTRGGWTSYKAELLYYENGEIMSQVSEECREKGAATTKIIANYHENGKLSKTEERYIESSGRVSRLIVCTYDENGKLLNKDDTRYP